MINFGLHLWISFCHCLWSLTKVVSQGPLEVGEGVRGEKQAGAKGESQQPTQPVHFCCVLYTPVATSARLWMPFKATRVNISSLLWLPSLLLEIQPYLALYRGILHKNMISFFFLVVASSKYSDRLVDFHLVSCHSVVAFVVACSHTQPAIPSHTSGLSLSTLWTFIRFIQTKLSAPPFLDLEMELANRKCTAKPQCFLK